MLDIWNSLVNSTQDYNGCVIARVISTWGSAPRQSGSALFISGNNEILGSVSGGCIESAVIQKSEEVRKSGVSAICSFGVSDDEAWSVGLTCGGTVEVYIEPFWANTSHQNLWKTLYGMIEKKESCVLATKLESEPANALINQMGVMENTGETLKEEVIKKAKDLLNKSKNELIVFDGVRYFLHSLPAPAKLIIIGAGHISNALSKFAVELEFNVSVIDPRTAFIPKKENKIKNVDFFNEWPESYFKRLPSYNNVYVALISHDPKIDDPVYPFLFKNNVRYIGALGGRKTNEKRRARLKDAGFSDAEIDRIYCPIGLAINAKSAGEIALSIMAQIILVKNG